MLTLFYLFYISFQLCSSFDIVNVTKFDELLIFELNYQGIDTILSFSNNMIPNSTNITMKIETWAYTSNFNFCIFLYDNFTKLNSDIDKDSFINYIKRDLIEKKDKSYTFSVEWNIYDYKNTVLYLFFRNNILSRHNIFSEIYSNIISPNITNIIKRDIYCNLNGISYYFYIPKDHKTHVIFGIRDIDDDVYGDLQIFEENSNIIKKKIIWNNSLEDYYQLENNISYIVKLTLFCDQKYIFFYFAQSDYFKHIFPAKYSTYLFQEFPVLNETNILLNLTNVKKGGKVIIEYEDDFFGYIKAYGYYSNDINNIQYQS